MWTGECRELSASRGGRAALGLHRAVFPPRVRVQEGGKQPTQQTKVCPRILDPRPDISPARQGEEECHIFKCTYFEKCSAVFLHWFF